MREQDDLDRRLEELSEAKGPTGPEDITIESFSDPEAEARAVERLITRRIRRICLKTLLGVLACAAVLFLCIHPLLKLDSLDPIKMEEDGGGFTNYLNAYYSTMEPYTQVTGADIRDTGFGTYDAALGITGADDLYVWVGRNTDAHMAIRRGSAVITSAASDISSVQLGRFACGWNTRETVLAELEKLPESCYIRLSVGTDAPLPLSQLRELPVEVVWAEVYNPDNDFQGGIALSPSLRFGGLEYPDEMDDAQMARYFADNLERLLSQPTLFMSLGIYSGNTSFYTLDPVKEALAFAREQTVLTSKNYCVAGEKAEILAFLQETETTSLLVDHIFLSRLSD